MFKTISIALFGLVLVIFEPCVTQNMTGPCPKYANQPNLELTKLIGTWYVIGSSDVNYALSCAKVTYSVDLLKGVIVDVSEIAPNGTEIKEQIIYKLNLQQLDGLFITVNATDITPTGTQVRPISVKNSLILTDYTNIGVFFSCYETNNMGATQQNQEFAIAVKSRSFDSLAMFEMAIKSLKKMGADFNQMKLITNNISCKN